MINDLISRRAVIDGIIELLKSPYANDPSLGMERRDAMKTVGDLCVRSLPTSYDVDKERGQPCPYAGNPVNWRV